MCPYRFPYRFTTGLRQVSDRFRRKSKNMYHKCTYKFPYMFPCRFTTGLRQVSDIIQRCQKCLPKSVTACVPTGFPTGLRQVSDRFPDKIQKYEQKCRYKFPDRFPYRFTTGLRQVSDIIQRFHKCLPKSVTACVPACFPRQVHDRFPTGSGENPKLCTKHVYISFPTGFPTGLRQVYDRFPK